MADKPKKISIADKILKRKQDPALQKQLAAEQIDVDKVDETEITPEPVTKSSLEKRELKKRQRTFKIGMLLLLLPALVYLGYWLTKPFESDMRFGFCRVFLELHVQYPQRLVLSEVEERRDFVRIWYMQTDAFGQERMENMECHHGHSEELGYFISKVLIDRRELDAEIVDRFNTSLTTIMGHPPDLTYPRRLRDALGNIDIQTYLFRKPIF